MAEKVEPGLTPPIATKSSGASSPSRVETPSLHEEETEERGPANKVQKGHCPCGGDCPKCILPKDLVNSNGEILLSDDERLWVAGQKNKTGNIPVKVSEFARGFLPLQVKGNASLQTPGGGKFYPLEIIDRRWKGLEAFGLRPVLAVRVTDGQVSGFLSGAMDGQVLQKPKAIAETIQEHPDALGVKGVEILERGNFLNRFENGKLEFGLSDLGVRAYFFSGQAGLKWTASGFAFDGSLEVRLPGLQNSSVKIGRNSSGETFINAVVEAKLGPTFKGGVLIDYLDGRGKIEGTLSYSTEKLSGDVKVIVADPKSADLALRAALGPENVINLGEKMAAKKEEDDSLLRPVLMGWGDVAFRFNQWFSGKTKIVFNHLGFVTIIGELALPPELPLMPRGFNYKTPEVGPSAKAFYGIPYLAEVYVAGGLSFYAYATVAPLVLRNLRVVGLYSTDPSVLQHFNIYGALNISAEAGVALSLWAKIGASVLWHDVSLKGTLESIAGIKAYADTEISLGYQERYDPELGKKGDFLFNGLFEFAAQPFLQLKGNLAFILDAPRLSPVSDRNEVWPFLDWYYPLPATLGVQFGLKDYVIGSEPNFTFSMGNITFNSDKFLDSVVEREKTQPNSRLPVPIRAQVPSAPPPPQTTKLKSPPPPLTQPTKKEKGVAEETLSKEKSKGRGRDLKEETRRGQFRATESTPFVEYAKVLADFRERATESQWIEKDLEKEISKLSGYKKYPHQLMRKSQKVKTLTVKYPGLVGQKGPAPRPTVIDLPFRPDPLTEVDWAKVNAGLSFQMENESHRIYAEPGEREPKIMMRSDPVELLPAIRASVKRNRADRQTSDQLRELHGKAVVAHQKLLSIFAKNDLTAVERKQWETTIHQELNAIKIALGELDPLIFDPTVELAPGSSLKNEFKAGPYSSLDLENELLDRDHEPQDKILESLKKLYWEEQQIYGHNGEVTSYSKEAGICLNLYKPRHRLTRTGGGYGGTTKMNFLRSLGITTEAEKMPVKINGKTTMSEVREYIKQRVFIELDEDQKVVRQIVTRSGLPKKAIKKFESGEKKVKRLNSEKWKNL